MNHLSSILIVLNQNYQLITDLFTIEKNYKDYRRVESKRNTELTGLNRVEDTRVDNNFSFDWYEEK